ncbi:MAG: Asp-tRNA(Asn)/Glu-tRNA(Gln) amidotransferase GatCAB subunit C [Planctomycetes bacterium]|nr:Asp-tRNA(Asn)/Glu-tRNA(Gln) amidotransferase GatCAB subunit C [Planctomycetota bacterium]
MIDRRTVEQIARLARLELDEERVVKLTDELSRILAHIDKLEELDVTDVPPLTHGTGGADVYRADVAGPVLDRDDALRNAPDQADGLFRVPRVIGDA